jgi:hypothetical protein
MRSLIAALTLVAVPAAFAADWKVVETPDFSVNLPGAAAKKEMVEQAESGEVKITIWGVQTPNAFFAVSIADYPKGIDGDVLERVRDGAMASVQATLERDVGVFLDSAAGAPKKKYEGREFDATTKSGIKLAARLFLVENRLYQMICVSPKTAFDSAAYKKFVESFKLRHAAASR